MSDTVLPEPKIVCPLRYRTQARGICHREQGNRTRADRVFPRTRLHGLAQKAASFWKAGLRV
jgi:hypothetical protein